MRLLPLVAVASLGLTACDDLRALKTSLLGEDGDGERPRAAKTAPHDPCITLLATNDLHGQLEARSHGPDKNPVREGGLPLLGAYIAAARATSKHGVLLVDAGDMYRGTFASDHFEGKPTIEAMSAIKYDAGVLGNHEFDFGAGEQGHDVLDVVKQRASEATFPILAVNVFDRASNHRIDWPNVKGSVVKHVGDLDVGIIGMSTISTPTTTFARNVEPLEFLDQKAVVQAESAILKSKGAQLIVLVGHVGTECKNIEDAHDASSCDATSEMQTLLAALPKGTVDIAVAGHTHKDVATWIDGIPVVESSSYARKLGRIDVCIGPEGGVDVANTTIRKPVPLCLTTWSDGSCGDPPNGGDGKVEPAVYEGVTIAPNVEVEHVLEPYFAQVRALKASGVGIRLPAPLRRTPSPMPQPPIRKRRKLVKQPPRMETVSQYVVKGMAELAGTRLALANAGSIRNDLPAGDISFGAIYDVCPFGNHVTVLKLKKSELEEAMRILVIGRKDPPATFGFEVKPSAKSVTLMMGGKPMRDGVYEIATSDFMAMGGDGIGPALAKVPPENRRVLDPVDRDALMQALRARYPGPLPEKQATPVKEGK
jgi:5'-nucleotidase